MSKHTATVRWDREGAVFVDNQYSRGHFLEFDGGARVRASASPANVRTPFCDPAGVDPEEAFVASISSCHMLWFLSIAAKRGFLVETYVDEAEGEMGPNAEGRIAVKRVTLRPAVRFGGSPAPTGADIDSMHHEAHDECYIANSVTTEIVCEPVSSAPSIFSA
jgi:organic hydroperoxide reductase OsmC/OhrA